MWLISKYQLIWTAVWVKVPLAVISMLIPFSSSVTPLEYMSRASALSPGWWVHRGRRVATEKLLVHVVIPSGHFGSPRIFDASLEWHWSQLNYDIDFFFLPCTAISKVKGQNSEPYTQHHLPLCPSICRWWNRMDRGGTCPDKILSTPGTCFRHSWSSDWWRGNEA